MNQKDAQQTGAPLLWSQAESAGAVHYGERKVWDALLKPSKGAYKEMGTNVLVRLVAIGQGVMAWN